MAKNSQPIAKRCKALGISPAVMGYARKTTTRNADSKNFRKKQSEYGLQLKEKQKLKFIYGVLEKQFYGYYVEAARRQGQTGTNLLQILECRLDNVVFRLGYASTRRDARQLVNHAHFTVNGKKVNIPSYQVKAGDVIEVRERSRASAKFAKLVGADAPIVTLPGWLTRDDNNVLKGTVVRLPERSDLDFEVAEHLVVELYSK
ncbi:MAG: 30S ribosomal protein S4 [Oscillospiraceae bacterium]|nr:30S ribosomal protein S4 [Oscillospiraceae bacterium]